jgi:hypothetical protein
MVLKYELDGSRAAYLTHLALEHEMVLKYVQAAVGRSIFQIAASIGTEV